MQRKPHTRISNRIRGLLTGIHPALERAIGPKVSHPAVLEILSRCGGPAGIAKAGRRKLTAIAKIHAPRMGDKLIEAIMTTLSHSASPLVTVGSEAGDTPAWLWCREKTQSPGMNVGPTKDQLRRGSALDECDIHGRAASARADGGVPDQPVGR
jgi:hypothetical protein